MYKYSSWRVFFFFAGAIIMQLFMIGLHANSTPALEKKQNDAMIASCEQNLIRSEHCILIAIPKENFK